MNQRWGSRKICGLKIMLSRVTSLHDKLGECHVDSLDKNSSSARGVANQGEKEY